MIEGDAAFVAFFYGTAADVPAVIVDSGEFAVFVDADGVEVAGDGFDEVGLAVAVGLLDGAEGGAVGSPCHVGTFAVVDERGAGFGGVVEGGDALFSDGLQSFGGHVGLHLGQDALEDGYFLFEKGCAIVAFDAALSFALGKVAAEAAFGYVVGDDAFFYYQHEGGFL